jgi:hypothetical protein
VHQILRIHCLFGGGRLGCGYQYYAAGTAGREQQPCQGRRDVDGGFHGFLLTASAFISTSSVSIEVERWAPKSTILSRYWAATAGPSWKLMEVLQQMQAVQEKHTQR